jgi:hypothetical protein
MSFAVASRISQKLSVIVGLATFPITAATQSFPRRPIFAVGGLAGAQHPSHGAKSSPHLFGLAAAIEPQLWTAVAVRASTTWLRSVSVRDDVSVCISPEPQYAPPNCFEPAYPTWYAVFAGDMVVRPMPHWPVYATVGVGWSKVSSKAYSWGKPATEDTPLKSSGQWRIGGGVTLGRSLLAPRIELTQSRFMRDVGTAQRLVALQLWLRL